MQADRLVIKLSSTSRYLAIPCIIICVAMARPYMEVVIVLKIEDCCAILSTQVSGPHTGDSQCCRRKALGEYLKAVQGLASVNSLRIDRMGGGSHYFAS